MHMYITSNIVGSSVLASQSEYSIGQQIENERGVSRMTEVTSSWVTAVEKLI